MPGYEPTLVSLRGADLQRQARIHAFMEFPAFIQSNPGAGKTSKARALARDPFLKAFMGYAPDQEIPFAMIPAQQATEESIVGFPVVRRTETGAPEVQFALPSFCYDRPMILVIDEANRAKENVRSALFPLLTWDRMINGWGLSRRSLVILLGNHAGAHAGVREFNRAVKGRMSHYSFEPSFEDWREQFIEGQALAPAPMAELEADALKRLSAPRVHPYVVQFLEANPHLLNAFNADSRSDAQPLSRTWEAAGKAWSAPDLFFSLEEKQRAVRATVGLEAAEQFFAYIATFGLPTTQDLVLRPGEIALPDSLEHALMLARSLGGRLSEPMAAGESLSAARGAAIVLTRLAEAGCMEPVMQAIRQAFASWKQAGRPVLLLDHEVQAHLERAPGLADLLREVGRLEMSAASMGGNGR